MPSSSLYNTYKEQMQQIADLRYAAAVLQWDQETYMPAKGNEARARQVATLSEKAHELFTTPAMGDLLQQALAIPHLTNSEQRNLLRSHEDYEKLSKLPSAFVRQLSATSSKAFNQWLAARQANNFAIFAPVLQELVQLKKEEAAYKGYQHHPYDALLDDYEKGATVQWLDKVFDGIRAPLKTLLDRLAAAPQVNSSFLHQHFPKQQQWEFGLKLLRQMGYDFDAGRQDISEHPFTTSFAATDVRVTTRIDEQDFGNMTWSCIHEGGHALYEQGLPDTEYGLPLGEACSLSIHESQSRLWENNVGRSLPFWKTNWSLLTQTFPTQFNNCSPEQFYKGINQVKPSLIRTEADELTYHFHVIIRYELEKALLDGTLMSKDIPTYWNEQYKKYLGVTVPDHKRGCLQDIHWSHGSFGYFPTYSLGSMYAAQLFSTIKKVLPNLNNDLNQHNTAALLHWLRENIHQYGRYFTSEELCIKATGQPLDSSIFLAYATKKYEHIYQL